MQFETYGVGGRSKGKIFISRNTYAKEMAYKSLAVVEQGMPIEYVERLDHLEFLVLLLNEDIQYVQDAQYIQTGYS